MELLRKLMKLQEERGFLDDEVLQQLAKEWCVPLYRLEELASKNLIFQSLERTNGNKGKAARLLELKRTTLVEKLRRMKLLEDSIGQS